MLQLKNVVLSFSMKIIMISSFLCQNGILFQLNETVHANEETRLKHMLQTKFTLMRSYSAVALSRDSSIVISASLRSSILRFLVLSPPNTLEDATISFSILVFSEEISVANVCTVNKAVERSLKAVLTECMRLKYS